MPFKMEDRLVPLVPGGVASHFVQILSSDQRSSRRRVGVGLGLALLMAAFSYMLYPWQGLVVHAGGALLGAFLGFTLAGRSSAHYEASMRGAWSQWMRFSVACESLPEVHRKVRGRRSHNLPYLWAGVLTFLWGLELLLLGIAFAGETSPALAVPVLLLNGLLSGGLLAYFWRLHSWYGQLRESVSELVESGEIGVWGVL